MAVNVSTPTSVAAGSTRRLPGPDVVRAVALIGVVVMNYHGYLILRGGRPDESMLDRLFDPWTGPLATRFAATFVLVAGVGVTLMTERSVGRPDKVTEMRWRLVRRGTLLYVGGLLLDVIWPGTIIPFYGGMFVIAAALFTLRSRWIVLIGVGAALSGWATRTWMFWRAQDDESTAWLTDPPPGTIRGHVLDLFVNGTHPLLPWLAFFCAGIVLGRMLGTAWWRPATIASGFALYALAAIATATATTAFELTLLSVDPYERGIVYVASALGTALIATAALDWVAERFTSATDPLRRAGQLSLSLYIAHILVFNFVVDWMGWIEPGGLGTALGFALAFWIVGIVAASAWSRHLGRGPAERVYRAIGG